MIEQKQKRSHAARVAQRSRTERGAQYSHHVVALILLTILLITVCLGALLLGVQSLTPSQLFKGLTDPNSDVHTILWEIRIPRIALAAVVGASLAVAGVLSQSLFANPIAEPSIIGVASGAATGLLLATLIGITTIGSTGSLIAAIVGGVVTGLALSRFSPSSPLAFLLSGIATAAVLNAVIGLLTSISRSGELRSIAFWTLGSFSLATWSNFWLVLPVALVGITLALLLSNQLDYLSLGNQSARHLGIEVKRLRSIALIALGLLVSASVAVTGIITFVGLAVPHIVRLLFKPMHGMLIALSAITGATLVVVADTLSRWLLQPTELPIGLITAILGAPILLAALRTLRENR